MRPRVIITDFTDLSIEPALRILTDHGFEVDVLDWARTSETPEAARRAVAGIVGYAHLDERFFDTFPDLRFLATSSTGTDMIDGEVAAARGVEVRPLRGASTEEVATHALALMLAVERRLPEAQRVVASGGWAGEFTPVPRRLSELTLGICGMGQIGARFAELARPLVGRIIGYDPLAARPEAVAEAVGFDELLARSDVLSLHLPLLPETRGLIGAAQLAALPAGATLVNVSRGELVDLAALVAALDVGALGGAGLDVLDAEPPAVAHPLRRHDRAVVTPHMGFLSRSSLETYEREPAEAIVRWWRQRGA